MSGSTWLRSLGRALGLSALASPPARRPGKPQRRTDPRRSLEQLEDRLVPTAAVCTELPDYHPDTTATIFGIGFQVGETVQLQVLRAEGENSPPGNEPWLVQDGCG